MISTSLVEIDTLGPVRRLVADAPELHPIGLREVVSGAGAVSALPQLLARLGRPRTAVGALLTDDVPKRYGGGDVVDAVAASLRELDVEPVVLHGADPGGVHADEATIEQAVAAVRARSTDFLVTVGSGTVADIGKVVAQRLDLTHVVVPTAASVNGYADDQSVLLRNGTKRTTPSRWPDALVVDSRVLADSPVAMTRSGLGDLLSTYTACADWRLAADRRVRRDLLGDGREHPALRARPGGRDGRRPGHQRARRRHRPRVRADPRWSGHGGRRTDVAVVGRRAHGQPPARDARGRDASAGGGPRRPGGCGHGRDGAAVGPDARTAPIRAPDRTAAGRGRAAATGAGGVHSAGPDRPYGHGVLGCLLPQAVLGQRAPGTAPGGLRELGPVRRRGRTAAGRAGDGGRTAAAGRRHPAAGRPRPLAGCGRRLAGRWPAATSCGTASRSSTWPRSPDAGPTPTSTRCWHDRPHLDQPDPAAAQPFRRLRPRPGRHGVPRRPAAPGRGRGGRADAGARLGGGLRHQQAAGVGCAVRRQADRARHRGGRGGRRHGAGLARALPGPPAAGGSPAHHRRAAGRRGPGRRRVHRRHRPRAGRRGRRLLRPRLRLRQAPRGVPRRTARCGHRGDQPRPLLPHRRRWAAGLRRDAGGGRGVHRASGRGGHRQAQPVDGGGVARAARSAAGAGRDGRRPAGHRRRDGSAARHGRRARAVRCHHPGRPGRTRPSIPTT